MEWLVGVAGVVLFMGISWSLSGDSYEEYRSTPHPPLKEESQDTSALRGWI